MIFDVVLNSCTNYNNKQEKRLRKQHMRKPAPEKYNPMLAREMLDRFFHPEKYRNNETK